MSTLQECPISKEQGVTGDTRGRPGPRQVTVMSAESWRDACSDLEMQLDWTTRRANLLIDGIDLRESEGKVLHIGADVELLITGELDPCGRMDEACPGLRKALIPHWRGGVMCRVLVAGDVGLGNAVELRDPQG